MAWSHLDNLIDNPNILAKRYLANLDKREVSKTKYELAASMRRLREINIAIKEFEFERDTDWDKIKRDARKKFTWLDIAILKVLQEEGEFFCMNYGYLEYTLRDHLPDGYDMPSGGIATIRRRTRRLMRMDLVRMVRGLMNDEGEVAGSGFEIVYSRENTIKDIIRIWESGTNQLNLVEQ